MDQIFIAAGIFLFTYALIVTERIHRTISALLGGLTMILLGVIGQHEAMTAVDWNVIFLLAGMMIIANIIRETGLFQWIAVQAVKLGKGIPIRIMVILMLVTAVSSAFLDNVTVVVLIAPVTLFVASSLGISPVPFLISEVMASNIGGASTLIGDPPNILIGSAADIDFITFLANVTPVIIIIIAVFIGMAVVMFRRELSADHANRLDVDALDTSQLITNPRLLRKSLVVMAFTLMAFVLQGVLHLEPATIAMTGATVLMLWARSDPDRVLRDVEWTTLFFFVGLFIVVAGIVEVGIIDLVAARAVALTQGSLPLTTLLLLWLSGIISGIIDNIPYTAVMIPIVESLGGEMPIAPLWWALALGADLGGNLTIVGASANVIAISLAERSGHPISFRQWLRYGIPVVLMSLIISTIYLWIRYL